MMATLTHLRSSQLQLASIVDLSSRIKYNTAIECQFIPDMKQMSETIRAEQSH